MSPDTPLTQLLPQQRALPPEADESALAAVLSARGTAPRATLQDADADRPWVRANMVTTVDGAVTGSTGRSHAISSPADKRVFGVLRSLADAVIVGAGTARAERYTRLPARPRHARSRAERGQAPAPLLALISRSGNIDLDRLDEEGHGAVVVHALRGHCPAEQAARIRERLGEDALVLHEEEVAPAAVLADLCARGCRSILHEGGPHLLADWLAAQALDELCLTTSPLLAGQRPEGSPAGLLDGGAAVATADLTLLSLLTDGSTLLQRWGLPLPE